MSKYIYKFIVLFVIMMMLESLGMPASFFQKTGLVVQTTVTPTAGGTTTLTATANQVQLFSGASNQTMVLPDATLLFNGWQYDISNESTGNVTVKNSAAVTLFTLNPGIWARVWLTSKADPTSGWRFKVNEASSSNPSVLGPLTSTDNAVTRWDGTTGAILQDSSVLIDDTNNVTIPSLGSGVVHSGAGGLLTSSAVVLTSDVTGTLPVDNGGTERNTLTKYSLLMGDGTNPVIQATSGTTVQVLHGGGSISAPVFSAVDLNNDTTGNLDVNRGGTGRTSLTQYSLILGNATSPVIQATAGTSTQFLRGSVLGAPFFDSVNVQTDTTGTLGLARGGTGQVTANAALNALLPTQTANQTKFLQTDGSNTSWATPTQVILQEQYFVNNICTSTTASIPSDGTIPQITEGTEYMSATITPRSSTSRFHMIFDSYINNTGANTDVVAFFKEGTANALAGVINGNLVATPLTRPVVVVASSTSVSLTPIRFSVRYGTNGGTLRINCFDGSTDLLGGTSISTILIREIQN